MSEGSAPRLARRPALLTLLILAAVLATALAILVPWNAGADLPRVEPDPSADFTREERQPGEDFHAALRWPSYISYVLGIVVALALGLTTAGARIVGALGRLLPRWWLQVPAGVVLLSLVGLIVSVPFGVWAETIRRDAGLSTQAWSGWVRDLLVGFGVGAGLTAVALTVLVGLARWLPRLWFVPAAAGGAALVIVLSFAYPLVFEPLFNDFEPMEPGGLRSSLLDLAERDGLVVDEVLVVDASRRTSTLNAYVSGFGGTSRIVVYDTLLAGASDDEIRLVVAHEIGHASARDVLTGTVIGAVGTATGTVLLALILDLRGLRRRAGVNGAGDPRSVGLMLAVVTALTVVAGPVEALVSRQIETRADIHSLELTEDPDTLISLQRTLSLNNLSDVDPPLVPYLLFSSHPSTVERIALARAWAHPN